MPVVGDGPPLDLGGRAGHWMPSQLYNVSSAVLEPLTLSPLSYVKVALSQALTKCAQPLRHLAPSSTKSSLSTNQNASFGRLSTKSDYLREVSKWFDALCHTS